MNLALPTGHSPSWVFPPPHTTCLVDFDRCQVISDNCILRCKSDLLYVIDLQVKHCNVYFFCRKLIFGNMSFWKCGTRETNLISLLEINPWSYLEVCKSDGHVRVASFGLSHNLSSRRGSILERFNHWNIFSMKNLPWYSVTPASMGI